MKYPVIIVAFIALNVSACNKSSSDAERIRQLEEENARLRRAAGQNAALVPTAEKPPQDVIGNVVRDKLRGWNVTSFKVNNDYTRTVKDETFHICEVHIVYTDEPPRSPERSLTLDLTLGFVKRGNTWYSRSWNNNE